MAVTLCYIKEEYFILHKDFSKMLDAGNPQKQSRRTHLFLELDVDSNHYCIPLRNNLGDPVRKYGRIGHSIPSDSRKNAGLDYRYALIVNNTDHIELQNERKIPRSQIRKIHADYDQIRQEFEVYLRGFIKAAKKQRIAKEPLYRESSLCNFTVKLI